MSANQNLHTNKTKTQIRSDPNQIRSLKNYSLTNSYISNIGMLHGTEKLNSLVQVILLAHLLNQQLLGSVAADDEVHIGETTTNLGNDFDHQVDTLAINETR